MTPTGFFFYEATHRSGRIDYFVARSVSDLFDRKSNVIDQYRSIRVSAPVCFEHIEVIDQFLKTQSYGQS